MLQWFGDILGEHGQNDDHYHHDDGNHQDSLVADFFDRQENFINSELVLGILAEVVEEILPEFRSVGVGDEFDADEQRCKADKQEINQHGALETVF